MFIIHNVHVTLSCTISFRAVSPSFASTKIWACVASLVPKTARPHEELNFVKPSEHPGHYSDNMDLLGGCMRSACVHESRGPRPASANRTFLTPETPQAASSSGSFLTDGSSVSSSSGSTFVLSSSSLALRCSCTGAKAKYIRNSSRWEEYRRLPDSSGLQTYPEEATVFTPRAC